MNIFIQLLVSEPKNMKSAFREPIGAPRVMFESIRLQMLRTIEFDDEFGCEANKVYDVGAERGLAAEFVAIEFLCAEKVPESFFSWCGFVAKRAGEVALGFVSVHGTYLSPP